MQEPIELEFSVSKQDYIQSTQSLYSRTIGWWSYLILTASLFVYSIFRVFQSGFRSIEFLVISLVFPLFLLYYWVFLPQIAASRAMKKQRFFGPMKLKVDESGFEVSSQYGEYKIEWEDLVGFYEQKHYYILPYSAKNNDFDVIPKSAFVSDQQQEEFYSLVEQMMEQIFG